MATLESRPRGVHLVGSIPLPTAEDAMTTAARRLPGHLRRLPDGETGERDNWVSCQVPVLASCASVVCSFDPGYVPGARREAPTQTRQEMEAALAKMETGYDTAAIESYNVFCNLRERGIIPQGVRFQVGLPTPVAVVSAFVQPAYKTLVEPFYEAALLRALRRIQDTIPANDLAVQWELPAEVAMLEGLHQSFAPWFEPVAEGIYERFDRLMAAVDPDVEVGLHLCYGDYGHKHFLEPKDTQLMVNMVHTIHSRTPSARKFNWVHMPVPRNRDDDEYFEPLRSLELPSSTELYLGLVHENDPEGTKRRIASALKAGVGFGVSMECGMGRVSAEDFDTALKIAADVSAPFS